MSSRPKRSTVASIITRHEPSSATSSAMNAALAPDVVSAATAASLLRALRAATATAAPAAGGEPLRHADPDPAISASDDGDAPGEIKGCHRKPPASVPGPSLFAEV